VRGVSRAFRRVIATTVLVGLAASACGVTGASTPPPVLHHIPKSLQGTLAYSGGGLRLRGFPSASVPLPKGEPLLAASNASTPNRRQFLLTYAAPETARAEGLFMRRYVNALVAMGFTLEQHVGQGTASALYSLVDRTWEILVEGSSSTVQVSVVERR